MLGKGSTSQALLVSKDGGDYAKRVFKVALNDAAARRLEREAQQLAQLNDSHVARLLDQPFQAGPADARRTVIGVEYVGDHTLAEELRQHGPLTIHELERLGEDLFQAMAFLDRRGVWHRDIKPDNLALRTLDRKGRELVLFDFSLAGTPDTDLIAGTQGYLDPFLGTAARQRYDQAAELYAVAVTLHEMASGELPSWGDDLPDARLPRPRRGSAARRGPLRPGGPRRPGRVLHGRAAPRRRQAVRLAARDDPRLDRHLPRPGHGPAAHHRLHQQRRQRKRTTGQPTRPSPPAPSAPKRRAKATPATPLVAAGLSPYALSIAQQRLGVDTAGDLARVPARRITALRGIGSRAPLRAGPAVPRMAPAVQPHRGRRCPARTSSGPKERSPHPFGIKKILIPNGPGLLPDPSRLLRRRKTWRSCPSTRSSAASIPDAPELARVTGLAPAADGAAPVSPWAAPLEIARATGLPEEEVTAHLDRLRNRWQKSVKALTSVREDLVEILARPRPRPGLAAARRRPAGPARRRASAIRPSGCGWPRSASAPPSRPRSAATPPGWRPAADAVGRQPRWRAGTPVVP